MLSTSVAFGAPPSATDIASAKSLVMEGRALQSKGDAVAARAKFRAAYALVQTPIIGFDLARAHAKLGELVEAREVCLDAARLPVLPKESAEGAKARSECEALAATLAPRIATLTIVVKPTSSDVFVELDSASVPTDALGSARKVNPGSHVVRVSRGTWDERRTVVLAEGASKSIEFSAPTPPATSTPTSAVTASRPPYVANGQASTNVWHPLGLVLGAVGFAGTAVGSVLWIVADGGVGEAKQECLDAQASEACTKGPNVPAQDKVDALDAAKSNRTTWTVVTLVGAGAMLTGLVVAYATRPTAAAPTAVSLRVGPSFIGAEVKF